MQTAPLDPPPLLRDGCVEFPVHHVRGGTSTGLVIWEHWAPREQSMREELLRHLMGLPLEGTRPGNKQITGLGADRADRQQGVLRQAVRRTETSGASSAPSRSSLPTSRRSTGA